LIKLKIKQKNTYFNMSYKESLIPLSLCRPINYKEKETGTKIRLWNKLTSGLSGCQKEKGKISIKLSPDFWI